MEPLFTLKLTKAELAAVFASVGMMSEIANMPMLSGYKESADKERPVFESILRKTIEAKAQHPDAFEEAVVVLS